MFYYTLHLFLIHLMAIASRVRFRPAGEVAMAWRILQQPASPGIRTQSAIHLLDVDHCCVRFYFPCKWYAGVKARQKDCGG